MKKGPVSEFIQHHYRHFNAAALMDAAKGYVTHIYVLGETHNVDSPSQLPHTPSPLQETRLRQKPGKQHLIYLFSVLEGIKIIMFHLGLLSKRVISYKYFQCFGCC
jgi:hypothetical protein